MRINRAARTITLKVVYYGAGLCGKTTNLVRLHTRYAADQRGELIKLDTDTERTLFFDYFPLDFGSVGGHRVKIDFFTVPGQSFYSVTRQAVLEAVDGIVFVADSQASREEANLTSHDDMVATLHARGRDFEQVPIVYQWNKRDLPRVLPVKALARALNPRGAPSFEAVAAAGSGVWETQASVVRQVVERLRAGVGRTPVVAESTHG